MILPNWLSRGATNSHVIIHMKITFEKEIIGLFINDSGMCECDNSICQLHIDTKADKDE